MEIDGNISAAIPSFGSPTLQGIEFEASSTPGVLQMKQKSGRQFVKFYWKDFYNPGLAKKAQEEDDPSLAYEKRLMVHIVTPGDKTEYEDRAHDYHKRQFWAQYQAFLEGKSMIEGHSVQDCDFIMAPEATELLHMKIYTLEQLQDASDAAMEQLPRGFELRDHARNWCRINIKNATEAHSKRISSDLNEAKTTIGKQQKELDDLRSELMATRDLINDFKKPTKAKG